MLVLSLLISMPLASFGSTVTIGPNKEILLNGTPFFPIMIWLQNAASMATEKGYGINTFVGQGDNSTALDYCNKASAQGAYAVPSWNANQAASIATHPAMIGWVMGDEPDLQGNNVTPSTIRSSYDSIKGVDPIHATFLTTTAGFYSGDALPAWMNGSDSMYYSYPKYTDIIGFDYYPVYGWCRPDWVYKVGDSQKELVAKYAKNQKTTYQWIECVKTSGQWCSIPARGTNDGPYAYEIADEVWLAIINGANAIGYFTHSWKCPSYSQCCLSDSQIAMLKLVNGRITALTGALCSPASGIAVAVQGSDPNGKMEFCAKEFGGNLYVIAASVINLAGSRDTQQATITVPGIAGSITVFDENRTISVGGSSFTDVFAKTDPVHIYVVKSPVSTATGKSPASLQSVFRPAYSYRGSGIVFTATREYYQKLKIFSSSGIALREFLLSGADFSWDCTGTSGKRLAGGVYYALFSGQAGMFAIPVLIR